MPKQLPITTQSLNEAVRNVRPEPTDIAGATADHVLDMADKVNAQVDVLQGSLKIYNDEIAVLEKSLREMCEDRDVVQGDLNKHSAVYELLMATATPLHTQSRGKAPAKKRQRRVAKKGKEL